MSGIIGELKAEHRKIAACLTRVKEHGLFGEEARSELSRAGTILMEHLAKEERSVYTILENRAREDKHLEKTLRIFSRDMASIGAFTKLFFEKYPNGGTGVEFASDFGKLRGMLLNRVTREEKVIFEEYRRLASH